MKKNPIRLTVTNFVTAKGRRHKKQEKKRLTFADFFNDLENRGPFQPDSVFEKWTSTIRRDMIRAGTWVKEDEDTSIIFVQEYVSRLQAEFWNMDKNMKYLKKKLYNVWSCHFYYPDTEHLKVYKDIYLKIRVYGLRHKKFCLLNSHIRASMSYRRTVIFTYVTRYEFGIEYVENWRATCLAKEVNHKEEFHYCRPFGLEELFRKK
jgi:hypothetical protein